MDKRLSRDLDNYITGHYGEDQFKDDFGDKEADHVLAPTPAAMAFATRVTQEQFEDVTLFASMIDGVAQEARVNERARIFKMGFLELMREFWKGRQIHRASSKL